MIAKDSLIISDEPCQADVDSFPCAARAEGGAKKKKESISSSDILKASILIVDDQEANVILLEKMLRGAGYVSVASTQDPFAACELHRQNRYSLILLDLEMPGM